MLAYSEGEESSQQIAAQSFDAWTLVIVVFITAVLVGAMLIFMMAFLQRRRKEVGRKPKSLAHQPSAMNRQG